MQCAVRRLVITKEVASCRVEADLFVVFDAGFELNRACFRPEIGGEVRRKLPDDPLPLVEVAWRAAPSPGSLFGWAAVRGRQVPRHVFERDRDVPRPVSGREIRVEAAPDQFGSEL